MALPNDPPGRLKLGHIVYSNCFPVHARLLDQPRPDDPVLIEGVPATLNTLLAERAIDVAPASSIEYALHDDYRIIPELVIGSRGPVRSIVAISKHRPEKLGGQEVAIPTASATSVVLLKILLRMRWGVSCRFRWFDQSREDPFAGGAAAALFIGDVALRSTTSPGHLRRIDLGQEWWEETKLPFAFALWQVSAAGQDPACQQLQSLLLESREYGFRERPALASRYAAQFGMGASELERYWSELTFELDDSMREGLLTFYKLAAEIGEIPRVPALRWI